MELAGLIFDLDGVVVDSEFYRDAMNAEILSRFNKRYDRDKTKPKCTGRSEQETCQVIIADYQLPLSIHELMELRKKELVRLYHDEIPFVPGFPDFYANLRREFDFPVAIATGGYNEYILAIDERLGISSLFDNHIYKSSEVARHKPAPDIFIYAASQIGADPARCAVFEDAPNGIAASILAGTRTIALTRTFPERILRESTAQILGKELTREKILFIPDYSDDSYYEVSSYLKGQ